MSSNNINKACQILTPDEDTEKLLYEYLTNKYRKCFIEIGEERIVMPIGYLDIADEIENFEVHDSDIWIISYPKTGTTWTQEMVWLIINKLDYEVSKKPMPERCHFLEIQCFYDYESIIKDYPNSSISPNISHSVRETRNDNINPRFIKTHLPWCLLPRALRERSTSAKIVYITRNPKDVCTSFYHHVRTMSGFKGTFDEFCTLFLSDKMYYGTYWHMLDFWKRAHDENILFLKYEDMKRNLLSVIEQTSEFLIGKQLTKEQMSTLVEHLSFDNMKNNPNVNYEDVIKMSAQLRNEEPTGMFMRSGKVGSYKTDMSPDNEKRLDIWIKNNTKGIYIEF